VRSLGVRAFLREYWAWIAVPFVLVLALLMLAYFLVATRGPRPSSTTSSEAQVMRR
jgi:hypothetical protein